MPILEKHDATLIPVLDEPPWDGIPDFIPRRTDMIRSWGFYQAWQQGHEWILSLDDDTTPIGDPLAEYQTVFEWGAVLSDYLSVGALTSADVEMRGFPHKDRAQVPVAVQYGGWHGILDYDAEMQIRLGELRPETFHPIVLPVPRGVPVTGCAMNMAFHRDYTPVMWQLPLHEGRYNRWGDIWAGLLAKAAIDADDYAAVVVNGKASVHHDRASDPAANLAKEQPGRQINETLWEQVTQNLAGRPLLIDAYRIAAENMLDAIFPFDPGYCTPFEEALNEWLSLFGLSSSPDTRRTSPGSSTLLPAGGPS